MDILLPVCISVAVLGVVVAVVLWVRRRRGRAVQALAVGALPFGLYLTGLLPLVWSGAVEVVRWAGGLIFDPAVWAGMGLLALAVVLWVVGGMVARRTPGRTREPKAVGQAAGRSGRRVGPGTKAPAARSDAGGSGDAELDEIEALLRKRGIE